MTTVTCTHTLQSPHSPIRRPARHPRIGASFGLGARPAAAGLPPAADAPDPVRTALRPSGAAVAD